jgi:hypothetical protein
MIAMRILGGVALAVGVAVCGCGEVKSANDPDGGGDGPDAQPAVGSVSITAADVVGNGPLVGTPIYFVGPDGALVEEAMTDADGKASATVPTGSLAIVVVPSEGEAAPLGSHQLLVVADLHPGDDITLGAPGDEFGESLG